MKPEVVGYIRVSSRQQDLATQRSALENASERRGEKITRWYQEKMSATKSTSRPALDEVRNAARMMLRLEVSEPAAFAQLAAMLPRMGGAAESAMSGQGEVVVTLKTGDEVPPQLRLGRDFALDGDLVEVIAGIEAPE